MSTDERSFPERGRRLSRGHRDRPRSARGIAGLRRSATQGAASGHVVAATLRAAIDALSGPDAPRRPIAITGDDGAFEVTLADVRGDQLEMAAALMETVEGNLGAVGNGTAYRLRVPAASVRGLYLMLEQGTLGFAIPWHAVIRIRLARPEAIEQVARARRLPRAAVVGGGAARSGRMPGGADRSRATPRVSARRSPDLEDGRRARARERDCSPRIRVQPRGARHRRGALLGGGSRATAGGCRVAPAASCRAARSHRRIATRAPCARHRANPERARADSTSAPRPAPAAPARPAGSSGLQELRAEDIEPLPPPADRREAAPRAPRRRGRRDRRRSHLPPASARIARLRRAHGRERTRARAEPGARTLGPGADRRRTARFGRAAST